MMAVPYLLQQYQIGCDGGFLFHKAFVHPDDVLIVFIFVYFTADIDLIVFFFSVQLEVTGGGRLFSGTELFLFSIFLEK